MHCYIILCALTLSCSFAINNKPEKQNTSSSIGLDELNYNGEGVSFHCIFNDESIEYRISFDKFTSDGEIPDKLIAKLSNGKDLTLFIHGMGNDVNEACDIRYVRDWSIISGNNICILTYRYKKTPTTTIKIIPHMKKMVKTNRVEFVAIVARDLFLALQKECKNSPIQGCIRYMSQIKVMGFSLGAHIAGYACRYVYKATGEKVKMLIGLDPAKASLILGSQNYIGRDDAQYVQIIHTSSIFGTTRQIGHVDIYVESKANILGQKDKHGLAVDLQILTSLKKVILIADAKGNGIVQKCADHEWSMPKLSANQCIIGEYGQLENRNGSFRLDLSGYKQTIENLLVQTKFAYEITDE